MAFFIAVVALAIVTAVVLLAPIHIEVSAAVGEDDPVVRMRASVRWLMFRLPGQRAGRISRKSRRAPVRSKGRTVRLATIHAVLRSPGFARRCARLIADLVRLARPHRLRLDGRLGFEDPSETGACLGWLYALRPARETANGWSIRVEPDFGRPIVQGELFAAWSRSLGATLWPMLKFGLSPVVWRAARAGWSAARVVTAR